MRVQCKEDVCQEVELCLQCFAAGAEMGGHKNNHSYQFHVRLRLEFIFTIFTNAALGLLRTPVQLLFLEVREAGQLWKSFDC